MVHIDELGRVLIPRNIREPLGWKTGNEVELIPNANEKSLYVKMSSGSSENRCKIDELSRITIPKTIRNILGWGCRNTLEHIINENDKSITMKTSA